MRFAPLSLSHCFTLIVALKLLLTSPDTPIMANRGSRTLGQLDFVFEEIPKEGNSIELRCITL